MKQLTLVFLAIGVVASVSCSAAPNGGYHRKPTIARPGGLTLNETIKELNAFNAPPRK